MKSIGNKYSELLMNMAVAVVSVLNSLDDDYLESKEGEMKWKRKEVLGHLIDSAYNNHRRIIEAERNGNLIVGSYAQDEWVAKNNYGQRNVSEILETFYGAQQHLSFLISNLSNETLVHKHEEHNFKPVHAMLQGDLSLSMLVYDYLYHMEHHLKQIIPGYKSLLPTEYYDD